MTTDDERARKIAEAKARAEAARAARAGGPPAGGAASAPEPPAQPAEEAPAASPEPVTAQAQDQAAPAEAAPATVAAAADGADDRARKIAEAKARAEAARAARDGGAATPAAAEPATPAAPAAQEAPAAAASAAPPSADERARRIEEAKARAAAARAGAGKEPAAAATPAPAAAAAEPAAAAPRRAAAAAAPAAAIAPADGWKGEAAAPNRVLTARADTRSVMRRELQDQEVRNFYTRRSIVRTSFWAALGVMTAGFLLGFVNFFWPREVTGFGGIFRIPAAQVPEPGSDPKRFPEGKLYLVNLLPGEGVPEQFQALAAPSEEGGILALWQKCPHLGCTVPWRPEFDFEGVKGWFRCPCHGSTYTKAGVRVFGPAPRPMDTFAVTIEGDGAVSVDTSQITPGGPDNPQRAVLA
ncbi:MAG: ubiquinol-cytochrome c reductase iron-sulfur subunit [Dehalococcoidia bacterium]